MLTGSYTVTQADIDAGELVNTASAGGTGPDGDPLDPVEDTITTPVDQDPALTLAKAADPTNYTAVGEVVTYTFTVENTGNVTLTGVAVSDPLPGLSAVAWRSNSGTSPQGTFAPGEVAIFTARYAVTQVDINAGQVDNPAMATGLPPSGGPVAHEDHVIVTGPDAEPGLTLMKSDPQGNLALGETLTYVVTATNTGNVTLVGVVIVDTMITPDTITCDILEPGEACVLTGSYVVRQADVAAGQIINTASARGTVIAAVGDGTPIEPVEVSVITPLPALVLEKSVNRAVVSAGDVVSYSLRLRNLSEVVGATVDLVDTLPAGFTYLSGSARIDGEASEPVGSGRQLTWPGVSVRPGATMVVNYDVVVGASIRPGRHVNRARGFHPDGGGPATNEATAEVRVEVVPVFHCATVIGRVFDDLNHDGIFNDQPVEDLLVLNDDGRVQGKSDPWDEPETGTPQRERGIPGVRLVTPNGIAVTTDAHGRFSLPCAAIPRAIGSNFMLRLDERTLPLGYRVTSENPRVVRLTPGMLTRLNFGAVQPRVVRIDLSARAFVGDATAPRPELEAGLRQMIAEIARTPSVVRITYQLSEGESAAQARARARAVERQVRQLWPGTGRYALHVERVVEPFRAGERN